MKLRVAVIACALVPSVAYAGGLYLPGAGAVSTSRAGAAVASTSDGEALVINPAGLAKTKGTTITVSAAIISYAAEFTRRGNYDSIDAADESYEGQKFPTVKNASKPPLGLGSYQPIPVITVVSDLGGAVPGLHVAAGIYAPSAYPFRDLCTQTASGCKKYKFNEDFNAAPAPTRYDIMSQEAKIFVPTVAAAYSIRPDLDVGARFGLGFANFKSTVALWGTLNNYEEWVKQDSAFTLDASASWIPIFGFGVTYRPTPFLEVAANYSSKIHVDGKGSAVAESGPNATLMGNGVVVHPETGQQRCQDGGTATVQRGCVTLELPMSATIGARYKFLDHKGAERGDIELNVGWENWGSRYASEFNVVVDGAVYVKQPSGGEVETIRLQDSIVRHNFKDTYNARLGGSYVIPATTDSDVIVRAGIGYDTAAAPDGWLRMDLDGAARTTITAGAGYRTKKFEVNIGGGVVLEGTNDNKGTCNPTGIGSDFGCNGTGTETAIGDRTHPDPISPVVSSANQAESPINQGTLTSHYVLLMLGATTWF
ncbi:MAG TPA: outer membrane protein transport protein [Kofleriaceae bacterium]|jgi:long-subunit fatty acid transport protein